MREFVIYLVLLAIGLISLIFARIYERFPGDLEITFFIQGMKNTTFVTYLKSVSFLTNGYFMFSIGALIVFLMFALKKKREFFMSIALLILLHLVQVLKLIAMRPRPSSEEIKVFYEGGGFSFPSGHAFQTIVLFGFLIYLTEKLIKNIWIRRIIQTLSVVLVISVGISRIYLGAHWLSDVLAGYYFGGVFLLILITFWDKIQIFIDQKTKLKYFNEEHNR